MGVDPSMTNFADGLVARVIIADDHELAREGLKMMLSGEPWLEVVGTAANGQEALDLCHRERPDLVLMDIRMPVLDGLLATSLIKAAHPHIRVIVITVVEDPKDLFKAIEAGASGYLLKDASRTEILDAMREALRGGAHLSSKLVPHLFHLVLAGGHGHNESRAELTTRELEVLQLMARGKSNKEIAQEINVTEGTVKIHVNSVLNKLGVSDRTQAVVKALNLGLVGTGIA